MVTELERAGSAARKALEAAYEGECTIIERRDVKDEATKLSRQEEVTVLEGQPCKLSFEKLAAAARTETASTVSQGVKLFLAPEIRVNSGSRIVVTQNGVTGEYCASGVSAVYSTHQEIILELSERWA